MAEGEIKAAIEYQATNGPANLLITTCLLDSVYQLPEVMAVAPIETIKYLELSDGIWQVIIRGASAAEAVTLSLSAEEMELALKHNSIILPEKKLFN